MASYSYMAQIGVDTSALTTADKTIKAFTTELKQIDSTTKTAGESITLMSQKSEVLTQAVQATREKVVALTSAESAMTQALKNGDISETEYRAYQRAVESARGQLVKLESQQESVNADLKTATSNEKSLSSAVDSAADKTQEAATKTKSYDDALTDLSSSASAVKSDLQEIVTVAGTVVAAVGAATTAAVTEVVSTGMDFSQAMSQVKAVSGATGDELTALEEAAKEMGSSTSKTATEAANALQYMALAGWDTEEMLEGLEPILRASEAGSMDLATCSDLVTDSMSAMGLTTSQLGDYLNIVTAAQSNCNTTMQGLLEAYVSCGGTMKNLGVSIEESATLLGTLANRGIKASEAGNSLNSILINLTGGSSKAAGALDELGISAWNEDGTFKGIKETLLELNDALATCTDEQATLFESAIGGKTQLTTLQALISGVTEEYDELYDTLSDCDGVLMDTATTMQDNLTGDLTILKSALEGLELNVWEYLEEPFRNAASAALDVLNEISDSIANGELSGNLEKLGDSIATLLDEVVKLVAEDGLSTAIELSGEFIELLEWIIENREEILTALECIAAGFVAIKTVQLASDVSTLVINLGELSTAAAATGGAVGTLATVVGTVAPYLAIAAATVAVGVALSSLAKSYIEASTEASIAKTAYYEATEEMLEASIETRKLAYETKQACAEIDNNADSVKELWQEVEELTDEYGNVGENGSRVADLLETINGLTGLNIELIDGQVSGYSSLCDTMDDYIEKLRLEAKLEATKEVYASSLDTVESYTEERKALSLAYDEALKGEKNLQEWRTMWQNAADGKTDKTLQDVVNSFNAAKGTSLTTSGFLDYLNEAEAAASKATSQAKIQLDAFDEMYFTARDTVSEYEDMWTEYYASQTAAIEEGGEELTEAISTVAEALTDDDLEDYIRSAWSRISNAYTRNGNEYTEDMLAEMESLLSLITDKESDLYDTYYTKYVTAQTSYNKKIASALEEEYEAFESEAEEIAQKVTDLQEQLLSDYESAIKEYTLTGTALGENLTDTDGNERFILTDLQDEIAKLEKYQESMDKLKETGASDELLAAVMDFDYDDGSRQLFLDELLAMTDEQRERYYHDYAEYLEAVQNTAAYDVKDSMAELEETAASALSALDETAEAYNLGSEVAQQYIQGITDVLDSMESYSYAGILGGSPASSGIAAPITTDTGYISTDTSITINVAGTEVISGTINDYLRNNLISGGNNTYV